MRWIKVELLVMVIILLLIPLPVLAATSDDITVTATGFICGAPGGFTLTYISDLEIGISWTKGEDAVNTMVRIKYGQFPESRTDGYQVYYGEGESTTDSNIDLSSPQIPYYRGWSQNAGGVWEEIGANEEANFMSASFLFIGLILIAGVLTYFALRVNLLIFRMSAALAWLGLGIWLLLSDSTNLQMSDTWTQIIGFVFILMTIGVLSLQMRTDIRHEQSTRGKQGFPGAKSESWVEWGPKSGNKNPSAKERQDAHRERLKPARRK